jgi:hypothetical protein
LRGAKQNWKGLLTGRTGVRLSEHIEGDGAIIFKHARNAAIYRTAAVA